ncbi:hypothetical protein PIB30_039833 [Stylosanthes scabra]|uniref:FAR1 domain-containing protein n=1 Tax=Stylosanthes scabra TaxID=79078 RepID=A0ABU6SF28_9FABA|nr:hypothetical protein [Stylosanthes scabra]
MQIGARPKGGRVCDIEGGRLLSERVELLSEKLLLVVVDLFGIHTESSESAELGSSEACRRRRCTCESVAEGIIRLVTGKKEMQIGDVLCVYDMMGNKIDSVTLKCEMDETSVEEVNGAESGEGFVGAEREDGKWEDGEEGADPGRKSEEEEDVSDYDAVAAITEEEICKKAFRTKDKAYEFYKRLGRCHGFGVRKGDYVKDLSGAVFRRRFFCNRAGLRDEKHYQRLDRVRSHRSGK